MKRMIFTFCMMVMVYPSIAQGTWTSYLPSNSSIPFESVNCIEADLQDNIWIGNDNTGNFYHISRFDGTTFASAFQNGWVDDITVDDAGHIWASTYGDLKEWNGSTWISHSTGITGFWLFPIEADPAGNIWIFDYAGKILHKYDGSSSIQITTAMGLPSDKVSCMKHVPAGIYIGTSDAGLSFFNGTSFTTYNTTNSALTSNNIFDMAVRNDTLFMSLINGNLAFLHNGTVSIFIVPGLHYGRIALDSEGKIWLASYAFGIYRISLDCTFNMFNYSTTPIFDPWDQYKCITADGDDHIWVGTQQAGLLEYDPTGTTGFPEPELPATLVKPASNPLKDNSSFEVSIAYDSEAELDVYDLSGRWTGCIFKGRLSKGRSSVPVSVAGFSSGLYFYRLSTSKENLIGKFIVEQ